MDDSDAAGDPPLLAAIADGTFGLMKRPADEGRGLDGVARKARDYYNPATDILEEGASSDEPVIRPYGDTTGDGMVQLSFTLPIAHSKVAEGAAVAARQQDGHGPRDGRARQADGPRTSRSSSSTAGSTTSSTRARSRSSSATTRCSRPRRPTRRSSASLRRRLVVVGGCIGTDAHTVGIDAILNIKGFAGEKGLEYYREIKVVNLGAQVSVPAARRGRAREEKADAVLVSQVVTQRDAHLLNTREMSAAFREAYPADEAAAAGRRRAPLRRDDGRRARRRPRLQPRHDARRGRLLHRPPAHRPPAKQDRPHERPTPARSAPWSPTAATCPTPTPTTPATSSTAPTASASSATWPPSCASAPTATRGCSRPTPTCSSRPRCARATPRGHRRAGRGRHPARVMDFGVYVVARGAATEAARRGRGPRPAGAGHHGHRHRRRHPGADVRAARPAPACPAATRRERRNLHEEFRRGDMASDLRKRAFLAGQRRLTHPREPSRERSAVRPCRSWSGGPSSEVAVAGVRAASTPPDRSRRSVSPRESGYGRDPGP